MNKGTNLLAGGLAGLLLGFVGGCCNLAGDPEDPKRPEEVGDGGKAGWDLRKSLSQPPP